MIQLGLIGKTLKHSFSPAFFQKLFVEKGLNGRYDVFELDDLTLFPDLKKRLPDLAGVNVTIPYKREILKYVDNQDVSVILAGACNTLLWGTEGKIKAYNTDAQAFQTSVLSLTGENSNRIKHILILGTGGTARMAFSVVKTIYPQANVKIVTRVIRTENEDLNPILYEELFRDRTFFQSFDLIINTTPAGMFPHMDDAPPIPYHDLQPSQFLFDAIYNPEETVFLRHGRFAGCQTKGGLEMLHLQAIGSWNIWNDSYKFC